MGTLSALLLQEITGEFKPLVLMIQSSECCDLADPSESH
jgi:hypothetical protein